MQNFSRALDRKQEQPSRWHLWAIWLALSISVFAVVLLNTVNVPRGDDWDTPGGLLLRWFRDSVEWKDVFGQHNESRIVFAKAFFAPIAIFTGWNSNFLHLVNAGAAALAGALVVLLFPKGGKASLSSPGFLSAAAAIGLIASPIHWMTLLWSIQLITFLVPLCLLGGLLVSRTTLSEWSKAALLALACLMATFSYANGILSWAVLWPGWPAALRVPTARTLQKAVSKPSSVCFLVAALLCSVLYFWDFRTPPHHPGLGSGLKNPLKSVAFLLVWLSNPLLPESSYRVAGAFLGSDMAVFSLLSRAALGAVSAVAASIAIWRTKAAFRDPSWRERNYPWLALLAFGLVSGCLTALGRSSFGAFTAITERYVIFVAAFHLGVLGLINSLALFQPGQRGRVAFQVFGYAYCTALLVSILQAFPSAAVDKARSEQNQLTLATLQAFPDNPLRHRIWGKDLPIANRFAQLREAGFFPTFQLEDWLQEANVETSAGPGATVTGRRARLSATSVFVRLSSQGHGPGVFGIWDPEGRPSPSPGSIAIPLSGKLCDAAGNEYLCGEFVLYPDEWPLFAFETGSFWIADPSSQTLSLISQLERRQEGP